MAAAAGFDLLIALLIYYSIFTTEVSDWLFPLLIILHNVHSIFSNINI